MEAADNTVVKTSAALFGVKADPKPDMGMPPRSGFKTRWRALTGWRALAGWRALMG
jgi:hypothetical protein